MQQLCRSVPDVSILLHLTPEYTTYVWYTLMYSHTLIYTDVH